MAQDYSISKCTRKCALTGRELQHGEKYFSVVVPQGDSVTRIDIAADEWQGPQPEMIGWWRSTMPKASSKKRVPAPNGVLLDTLSELQDRPGNEELAYLLALLLVRRRVLNEERKLELDDAWQDCQDWKLTCPADGRQWNVQVVALPNERLVALQSELNDLLFTEA